MSVEIKDWRGAREFPKPTIEGRWVRLEPLDMRRHGADLWEAFGGSAESVASHLQFTGLPRFVGRDSFIRSLTKASRATLLHRLAKPFRRRRARRVFIACVDAKSGRAVGLRCLARIDYAHGSTELALAAAGDGMIRTRLASEAAYLTAALVFDTCGFRRYESHIALENEPARRAAERIGWHFDGVMRQRYVKMGGSFDFAVYTILADEWPPIRDAYHAWLEPSNFDAEGRQIRRLEDFRK
jgi:RimJ/RimL family protein N-acetyltransferase